MSVGREEGHKGYKCRQVCRSDILEWTMYHEKFPVDPRIQRGAQILPFSSEDISPRQRRISGQFEFPLVH